MKYLVTGCDGFIGTALVRRLEQDGHEVAQFDRGMGWFIAFADKWTGCEPSQILKADALDRRVVHLAAMSGVEACEVNPEAAMYDNLDLTAAVSWWCDITEIPMCFISSAAATNATNVYGATKLIGEALCSQFDDIDYRILRLANVYGPGCKDKDSLIARWCKRAIAGEVLEIHGDGYQERSFVHIERAVDAIIGSFDLPSGSIAETIGVPASVNGVASAICNEASQMHIDVNIRTVHNREPVFVPLTTPCYYDFATGISEVFDDLMKEEETND